MINYANSTDCYQIWADMVCYDEVRNLELDGPAFTQAGDCHTYKHSNEQIMARYGNRNTSASQRPCAWTWVTRCTPSLCVPAPSGCFPSAR